MDSLSKHQLILVALLISFVTSLATGIVTVSLMSQAPQGVTRTITQVIRETVASAVPAGGATSTAAVSIAVDDQVADSVSKVSSSIVKLRDGDNGPIVALGLVVGEKGVIMTDKNIMDKLNAPEVVLADNSSFPVAVIRFQIAGNIAFLAPTGVFTRELIPIDFAQPARLGATVWTLSGSSTLALSQGIISKLEPVVPPATMPIMETSITADRFLLGAPLFDATGAVVGIATGSGTDDSVADFYPIQAIKYAIPE